jgi:transposase
VWTPENRSRYDRRNLRYASGLSDQKWTESGPFIPPAKRDSNKRAVDIRKVVNGVMYTFSTGCQWRLIYSSAAGIPVYDTTIKRNRSVISDTSCW